MEKELITGLRTRDFLRIIGVDFKEIKFSNSELKVTSLAVDFIYLPNEGIFDAVVWLQHDKDDYTVSHIESFRSELPIPMDEYYLDSEFAQKRFE